MIFTIDAQSRHTVKKSDLTKLRASGSIPAVIYGPDMQSISVTLNKADFMKVYKKSYHAASFYTITMDGKKYFCVLKDRQIHPVTRDFLHIDFLAVPANKSIDFDVPLHFEGQSIGEKSGGMVDILHHTVKISCIADQIPDAITVDVSNLEVGHAIHVSDLPKGTWQYKEHADVAVVAVHPKKGEAPKAAE